MIIMIKVFKRSSISRCMLNPKIMFLDLIEQQSLFLIFDESSHCFLRIWGIIPPRQLDRGKPFRERKIRPYAGNWFTPSIHFAQEEEEDGGAADYGGRRWVAELKPYMVGQQNLPYSHNCSPVSAFPIIWWAIDTLGRQPKNCWWGQWRWGRRKKLTNCSEWWDERSSCLLAPPQ